MRRLAFLTVSTALLLTACSGGEDKEPESTPEPEPTVDLAATSPQGDFTLTNTVLESEDPDEKVGDTTENTWTLSACSGDPCVGSIESDSGRTFTYEWNGSHIQVTRDDGSSADYPAWGCEIEGEWVAFYNATVTYTYEPFAAEVDTAGQVTSFSGVNRSELDLTTLREADTYAEAAASCNEPTHDEVIDSYGGEVLNVVNEFVGVQN